MLNLDQIKKSLEEISPWPWYRENGSNFIRDAKGDGVVDIETIPSNEVFIAQAPTIISEMVQEVERLRKELEGR